MQGVIQRGVDMTKGIVLNEGVVCEVMTKKKKLVEAAYLADKG